RIHLEIKRLSNCYKNSPDLISGLLFLWRDILMNEFYVFDTKSNDEELTKRFHRFFKINGLDPLFTKDNESSHITVSDLQMRSLVNTGKTAQPLLEIRDL